MATLEVDNITKLNILKSSYSSIVSSFATICFQVGIDPFSIDIDTFVPPEADSINFGGTMARQVDALRLLIPQIAELEGQ
jgi:hypothetical protein